MKMILLVVNAVHLSEEIADILRMEGYVVVIANNATEVLEILPEYSPHLIITDLLTRGIDGFELIQHIRSMAPLKSVPIIILSAKTSEEDRIRGKEAGADAFIAIPCKANELLTTINSLIK